MLPPENPPDENTNDRQPSRCVSLSHPHPQISPPHLGHTSSLLLNGM